MHGIKHLGIALLMGDIVEVLLVSVHLSQQDIEDAHGVDVLDGADGVSLLFGL